MLINIGEWQLDVDASATRDVYDKTSRGSPADCDCTICHNFAALGDEAFPAGFRDLAERVGIDLHKAAEIHEWFGFQDNYLDYGGWYHCVGHIRSGPTDFHPNSNVEQWPWFRLTDSFRIVVDNRRDLAFDEFEDQPLVQVQFFAREPWVLSEAYPE